VNLQSLTKNLENYAYREPTPNPTNVNHQANDWEAGLIDGFRNDPQLTQLVTVRNTPAGDFLVLARPLKVDNAECLDCHSAPAKAPATMVALYGTDHGFGWKVGDTVGAQVVSIPLAIPLGRAYTALLWFMVVLAGIFLVVIVLVDPLLLRAIVVKPGRGDLGNGEQGEPGANGCARARPRQQRRDRFACDIVQSDAA
jgi:Protein of unknown function (DUF3365)